RGFSIRIDLRGTALELAERLDLFEPGVEIARIGAAMEPASFGFLGALLAAIRVDRDAHIHGRLPSCSGFFSGRIFCRKPVSSPYQVRARHFPYSFSLRIP